MSKRSSPPLSSRIRLGVSACLLGGKVRYDGSDKHQPWVTGTLGSLFELLPVCPETAIGLGVPRAPIHLVGDPARPRAVGVEPPTLDVTDRLEGFGRAAARELATVSGVILKARSPSCGLQVEVHGADRRTMGRGLFAHALLEAHPTLPAIDEEALGDPLQRDNFLERVFAWRRWQELEATGVTAARLAAFHTRNKLVLMAHSPVRYRELGRLIAAVEGTPRARADRYVAGFMATLALPATARKHANVLQHLMGYLKRQLGSDEKSELLAAIDAVRLGRATLAVPLTLLRHHFRRHPHPWAAEQIYLHPSPEEALLRCL
jgi:uncharacterized protein YbgA (DUF1722 family)/uncharacterized protein YbbK (DUF523 family)